MKRLTAFISGIMMLIILSISAGAAEKPDIIHHTAQYLDRALHVTLQWQSVNPVTLVRVSAGREAKEVKVDEYDNRRVPGGYSGEVTVNIPVEATLNQKDLPYILQLEDDLRLKSELVTGKATLPSSGSQFAQPYGQPYGQPGTGQDTWGHENLKPTPKSQGGSGDIIEKLVELKDKFDLAPSITQIKANVTGPNNVTFSMKANDDKQLREINIKVFDTQGNQVQVQQITGLGRVWEGTSQVFNLSGGTYRATAQAVDMTGNTSKEVAISFVLKGGPIGDLQPPVIPPVEPPVVPPVDPPVIPPVDPPVVPPVEPPVVPPVQPPVIPPVTPPVIVKTKLTVTLVPASAVTAGAQWRIGNGAWQNNNASIDVEAGKQTIEFKDVAGFKKPVNQDLTIVQGQNATARGAYGYIYTVNKDFEKGTLVGLEFQTVKDQLQLTKSATTLPFIWVPNSNDGSISKVDTISGNELGRYRTGPGSGSPSRTTVDLQGNCWVGNRNTGTVVKVGLLENGQCVDRNKNGKIDTSTGSNLMAWGQDECVLLEVSLSKGNEVTCTVGQQCPSNGSGPRGIAIDANNNLWAGTYNQSMYYQINGANGAILKKIDVSPHRPYGGIVDKNALLWSADLSGNVLRLNTATGAFNQIQLAGSQAYGMGLNRDGRLYVSGWCSNKLMMINTSFGTVAWSKDTGDSCSRGVAVTNDGDVWVANSGSNTVSRWSADGAKKATIKGFQHPTGVATDANGKVWVVDYSSSNIYRINPASNSVELTKAVAGPHYGYSDMTGIVSRSMTTKIGTWTVTIDSRDNTTAWDSLLWSGKIIQGTSLKVRVRSSKDNSTWSVWEDTLASTALKATPAARYLQVEATLQLSSGEVSPVLYDIMVKTK